MSGTSIERQRRNVEVGSVCGCHGTTGWNEDLDAGIGRTKVDEGRGSDFHEMISGTGVGNERGRKRNRKRGWGGQYS